MARERSVPGRLRAFKGVASLLLAALGFAQLGYAQCQAISLAVAQDYSAVVATVGPSSGGSYRWTVNGAVIESGNAPQLLLLHADGSAVTTAGVAPANAVSLQYQLGKWGSALAFDAGSKLAYARAGNLDVREGTVEMWVAPRASGRDPQYQSRDHVLFQYMAPNGDWIGIVQASGANGIIYAGGTVNGVWQSAWGATADMRDWDAGEWRHLAFTWSASANRMKMFVDGALVADTNEGHYTAPAQTGQSFAIGGSADGTAAYYLIDEVRISGAALPDVQIRADALRQTPFSDNELFLPLSTRTAGDSVGFVWTPSVGSACPASTYVYPGIPITAASPPSTILPPGMTAMPLTVQTAQADTCRYGVNSADAFAQMKAFSAGDGTTAHQATVDGLNPDPAVVNSIFVRCAAHPDYAMELKYRARGSGNAHFPRKGNLWGSYLLAQPGLEHAARIDLYLGAFFSPAQIRKLRALNPNILILTSINTVENSNLPEDYYLHTVNKQRIEVWPGTYRLNLTKPYVADYQAKLAYQLILDSGLLLDGCFFDNFFTSESWLKQDIFGTPVQLDADEDGVADDPAVLDAKWRAGVFRELNTWRQYMPYALNSGHLPRPPETDTLAVFNGDSIGFKVPQVKDGSLSFYDLFDLYSNWYRDGRKPVTMMLESAPPYQIGYGYGYDPLNNMPASTIEFARTYYPYVRFGLGVTLMNDGYFAYEIGDTFHGNDWWYDELDFDLGYPLGPAQRLPMAAPSSQDLIDNGGFESPLNGTWDLWVNTAAGAQATFAQVTSTSAVGAASVEVDVTNAGQGLDWHVDLHQYSRSLVQGKTYQLTFQAKSTAPRELGISITKQAPDWRSYGLSTAVNLTTSWQSYSLIFEATETVSDARLQFLCGIAVGSVWLDDVHVTAAPPNIYRRDFTNGTVLLNASRQPQSVSVGSHYQRLKGDQAARHEYILDDADATVFTAGANWSPASYDSGMWMASGPYYHHWGSGCHQCAGAACGAASWDLQLREDDTYTIAAWWPAAPAATAWTNRAVFELVSGTTVIATTTLDETSSGDQWHTLFTAPLSGASKPFVRVRNGGAGTLIADALWVRSAARYNDGSAAPTVTLEGMDSIVLRRVVDPPAIAQGGIVDAARLSGPLVKGSLASILGTNLAGSTMTWAEAGPGASAMPLSLDGTSVEVSGVASPLLYVSPVQVYFQVPMAVDAGPGTVQVIAPAGPSSKQPVTIADAAPALYAETVAGKQYAIAETTSGAQAGNPNAPPVASGAAIYLWGSGLGPTMPEVNDGALLPHPAPLADLSTLKVSVGGLAAVVDAAEMTFPGLYRIQVRVPSGLSGGDQLAVATVGAADSQPGVYLRVR